MDESCSESTCSDDSHSSESKDGCSPSTSTSNRFSPRQRAILTSYYRLGMVGTGKLYSLRHERSAAEVGCTVDKVKVCMQNWLNNGVFTISEMDKEKKSPREVYKTQK